MATKLQELQKIVKFCKKNGIIKLKTDTFDIELSPAHLKVPKTKPKSGEIDVSKVDDFPAWSTLSQEQQLLWSSTPHNVE